MSVGCGIIEHMSGSGVVMSPQALREAGQGFLAAAWETAQAGARSKLIRQAAQRIIAPGSRLGNRWAKGASLSREESPGFIERDAG